MAVLILHIVLYILVVYSLGLALRWWSKREDSHSAGILWSGLSVIFVTTVIFAFSVSGLHKISPNDNHIWYKISKKTEINLIWVVIAVTALFMLWRLSEIISEIMRLRQIKKTSWDSTAGIYAIHSEDSGMRDLEKIRINLQEFVRDETQNERSVLRLSSKIQLPFTVGVGSPSIYVPIWVLRKDSGVHVEHLISHECQHIISRHNFWIQFFRPIFFLLPFVGPIMNAVRHAFEAESDRKIIEKFENDAKNQYLETLKSVVAPALGSGLEVGLGHDRRNIPLRIKQAFSKPAMRWDFVFGSVFAVFIYGYAALSLGGVNYTRINEGFNRAIPANYYILNNADALRVAGITGDGGCFEDGLYIDATKYTGSRPIVVSFVRETDLEDKWDGYIGEVDIKTKYNGSDAYSNPYLVGTAYSISNISLGSHRNEVIDKHIVQIAAAGTYTTKIIKAKTPGDCSGAMTWELNIPPGWEVWLTNFKLTPNSGVQRPPAEVAEAQLKHLALLGPRIRRGYDQAWDLMGRPFFAD